MTCDGEGQKVGLGMKVMFFIATWLLQFYPAESKSLWAQKNSINMKIKVKYVASSKDLYKLAFAYLTSDH